MQIARKRNAIFPQRDEDGGLIMIDPVPGKRPLIQFEAGGDGIETGFVLLETTRGCKVQPAHNQHRFPETALLVSGAASAPCALTFNSARKRLLAGTLLQEFLNPLLGLVVFSFPEMVIAHFAVHIDEIMCGPVFIVEGAQIM